MDDSSICSEADCAQTPSAHTWSPVASTRTSPTTTSYIETLAWRPSRTTSTVTSLFLSSSFWNWRACW